MCDGSVTWRVGAPTHSCQYLNPMGEGVLRLGMEGGKWMGAVRIVACDAGEVGCKYIGIHNGLFVSPMRDKK